MSKPRYLISVPGKEYKTNDGEVKKEFTSLGTAFLNENGSINCILRQGCGINGDFVLFPDSGKDSK